RARALGRSGTYPTGPDQPARRGPRRLLRGPRRPLPRDPDPTLRQRLALPARGKRAAPHPALARRHLVQDAIGQLERRQCAPVDQSGVDADLVRQMDQHLPPGSVPEDDGFRHSVRTPEDLLTDPEDILVGLLLPRHTRSDAGMHEEVPAPAIRTFETLQ